MQDRDGHRWLGRAGFAAKGVLYGIIGIVAAAVAFGSEKSAADQTGALSSLAGSSVGKALLVAMAIGLGAYALFRLVEVFTGSPTNDDPEDGAQRIASVVRALIYGGLCVSAVLIVADASSKSGSNESKATSTVFDLPAGVALVLIAGVVIVGVGIYQAYQSWSNGFRDELETGRMSPAMQRAADVTGVAGHAARAVIYGLIGGFLIKAAVEHDSSEAVGLDGALQEVAQQTFGSVLLLAVAVGLVVYGTFCLIEARYHKF